MIRMEFYETTKTYGRNFRYCKKNYDTYPIDLMLCIYQRTSLTVSAFNFIQACAVTGQVGVEPFALGLQRFGPGMFLVFCSKAPLVQQGYFFFFPESTLCFCLQVDITSCRHFSWGFLLHTAAIIFCKHIEYWRVEELTAKGLAPQVHDKHYPSIVESTPPWKMPSTTFLIFLHVSTKCQLGTWYTPKFQVEFPFASLAFWLLNLTQAQVAGTFGSFKYDRESRAPLGDVCTFLAIRKTFKRPFFQTFF